MKLKDKKAITLVALIVMIIILIILAGVSISLVLGERGLITIAKKAKENMELAQKEEINEINDIEKLLNDMDEQPKIIISDKDKWSNTNKKVIINKKEGYTVKYTIDGSNPSNNNGETYTGEFEVDKNCTIKAIYILNGNVLGKIAQEEITKIDKLEPNSFEISLMPEKTAINVEIISETTDQEATKENGKSEIAGYRYNCRYNNENHISEVISEKTYQFTEVYGNLEGVECEVIVEAIDNAGNSKQITNTTKTTCLNSNYIINGENVYLGKYHNDGWYIDIYKVNKGNSIVWGYIGKVNSNDYACLGLISSSSENTILKGYPSIANSGDGCEYSMVNYHGFVYHYSLCGSTTGFNNVGVTVNVPFFGLCKKHSIIEQLDRYYNN